MPVKIVARADYSTPYERISEEDYDPEKHTRWEEREINATSGAEELAEEEGIDLFDVEGTGKDGRVTKADVQDAVD